MELQHVLRVWLINKEQKMDFTHNPWKYRIKM
jgi:hypothetical protein